MTTDTTSNAVMWDSATEKDIGRLGRFRDRAADDWCYGMLIACRKFSNGLVVYRMAQMDNDEMEESFFKCDVQSVVNGDMLFASKAALAVFEGKWTDAIEPSGPSGAAMNLLEAAIQKSEGNT